MPNWFTGGKSASRIPTREGEGALSPILQLVEYLVAQISAPARATSILANVSRFQSLPVGQRERELPGLYLMLEEYLAEVDPSRRFSRHKLRGEIRSRFPSTLQVQNFKLIFEPNEVQEVLLCRNLLQVILQSAYGVLGAAEDNLFGSTLRWLEGVPDRAAFPAPLGLIDRRPRDGKEWVAILGRLSLEMHKHIRKVLGEKAAARHYEEGYREIADDYMRLETFPVLLGLIPDSLVDEPKISLLSRQQIQRVLLDKVDELQRINMELSSKNEALLHSERSFRALIENASDIITILNRDLTVRYESPSIERLLGFTPEELIGQNLVHLTHPQDVSRLLGAFTAAIEKPGNSFMIESRHRHKDGSWRVVESTGKNLLDLPGVNGIVVNSRDITERKLAEEALRESEERFRHLVGQAADAFFIHDLEGRLIDVNQQACESLGYTRAELLKMSVSEIEEEAAPWKKAELWSQLVPGVPRRLDGVHRRKDGSTFPVEVSLGLFESGRRQLVLSLVRDVTQRRHLEEQLRQSQKMEAVGKLAGGVAHDFNNLLTAISGYSQLLLSRAEIPTPTRKIVEEIRKAGDRAASLTSQLLAFSRMQVLQPKVLDLNEVVTDMDKMLRRLIGEDIELVTLTEPSLGHVRADPGQVEQILLNLAVNARDALPHGGKLTVETANCILDHSYASRYVGVQAGPYVMLAVSDNGIGMDAQTQARIFEPFFTTKEKGKGTGLGLSTVYGIVKQSGGHIWVYSEPGRGTTFKVYLPRVEDELEDDRAGGVSSASPRGTETVLLVEDEDVLRTMILEILDMNGYTVLHARNGNEALEMCERHSDSIHLLLTDVVMPGMSGRELAETILSFRPEIRVLYMSGYTDDAIVRHGVLEKDTAFIQKPFSPDALSVKVREVLDSPLYPA